MHMGNSFIVGTRIFVYLLTSGTLFCGCSGIREIFLKSAEYRLKEDLMAGYRRDVRPKVNSSEPLDVTVKIYPKYIVSLVERDQILTLAVLLQVSWNDDFLTWDSERYEGIKYTTFSGPSIWYPELLLTTSPSDIAKTAVPINNYNIVVYEDGSAEYTLHTHFTTSCDFNVVLYPLDTQVCEFAIRPHVQMSELVQIVELEVDTVFFSNSSEWEMAKFSWYLRESTRNNTSSNCTGDNCRLDITDPELIDRSRAIVTFTWQRMPGYHILTIVIPTAIIAASTFMSYWLPPDGGERVSVGLSVLLSLMVFQDLVSNYVPVSSSNMPLIIVYLSVLTVCTKVSLISSVIVINIQNRSKLGQRVPHWARRVIFNFLAYILCIRIPAHIRRDLKKQKLSTNQVVNCDSDTTDESKSVGAHGCCGRTRKNRDDQTTAPNAEENLYEAEWILAAKVADSTLFWVYVMLQGSAIFLIIGTPLIYKEAPFGSFFYEEKDTTHDLY